MTKKNRAKNKVCGETRSKFFKKQIQTQGSKKG